MSSLQSTMEENCATLLKNKQIYFAGLVNKSGKLISGYFKPEMGSIDEFERERILMSHVLIVSLNRDFDSFLGKMRYTISKREKIDLISFSIGSFLLLVAVDAGMNVESVAVEIERTIKNFISFA